MFHQDTADAEHFEQVIVQSVRQILASPDQEAFLHWARVRIPDILGLADAYLDRFEIQRLATLLGTLIWNATPQPFNAFRPYPMDAPSPDSPCVCGSGLTYLDCCGNLDDMPELSSDLVWEILIDELTEPALREALALNAIPGPLLAKIADRWLDEDKPGRVVTLLEPLFSGALEDLDTRYEAALDLLCDAYDRLDHWRKKRTFLDRLCTEGSRAIQSAAWLQRSTMHIDAYDYVQAEHAFSAALRSNPDNPSVALLEITLLTAQHKDWLAQERARFWLHRFRRLGFDDEDFMYFLARAVENPQEAMVDSQADTLDPVLVDLNDWMTVISTRPLPRYTLAALTPKRPPVPRALAGQLDLFEGTPAAGHAPAGANSRSTPIDAPASDAGVARGLPFELRASAQVRQSQTLWRVLYPAGKPYSTHLVLSEDEDVWSDTDWVDYLLGHPEVADSLDVLDDLATALYAHPESALPWISHALLGPLIERAWSILEHVLEPGDGRYLPWSCKSNRPLLRLLFRRYLCRLQEGQPAEAIQTLETLLRLNPQDNHGVRAELINHYLRNGEDERAVALAQRFPDDLLADLAYGEVLALYRLGRQEQARSALKTAVHRLPQIPRYLTRKRIKQPHVNPLGITPGGEDQAWLYREAMLDVWVAEPGALAWLKRYAI